MKLHRNFRLNNISHSQKTLVELAESYFKNKSEYLSQIGKFILEWYDQNDYIKVYTSGSTGTPKQIKLSKTAMYESALATGLFFDLKPKTRAFHCLPTKFIAGKMMLLRSMVLGLHVDICTPSSTPLDKVSGQYDFSAMTPLQVSNSIKYLHKIKLLIIGGGVISNSLLENIKHLPLDIFETYGMTETISHIAVRRLNEQMSYFRCLPNISVETDSRGCLIVSAPRVSSKKIVTNDLVKIIDNKSFIWQGRVDNVINSGGVKLIPELIEKKIQMLIKVNFFITGIRDNLLGEKLVLIIESKYDNYINIKNLLSGVLDKFEIPKQVFFLDKFIYTPTRKINRPETLDLALNTQLD